MRPPIKTFEDFRDALSAYRLPRVILTALELKLFTVIGKNTWLLPDLARELKVSERGLSILCRNLAMAGLLYKKGNRYRNSPLAATALNADDRAYRGSYLHLITNHWTDWLRLMESIRTGEPLDKDEPEAPDCIAVLESEQDVLISAGTVAEAMIVGAVRNVGPEMETLISQLGFEIIPVTGSVAMRIAQIYAKWGKGVNPAGLNFGDCFAYDVAKQNDCGLLYVGEDFSRTDLKRA